MYALHKLETSYLPVERNDIFKKSLLQLCFSLCSIIAEEGGTHGKETGIGCLACLKLDTCPGDLCYGWSNRGAEMYCVGSLISMLDLVAIL